MPTTPQYAWPIPNYTEPADGPGALRALGTAIEATLKAGLTAPTTTTAGTLAARPAPSKLGATYLVTSGAGTGTVYVDSGSAWFTIGAVLALLDVVATSATDVPLQVYGASGQIGDLAQFLNTAGTVLARISARGAYVGPTAPRKALAYNGAGQLATVTITDAAGTTTLQTQTLTYDATSGNLTQVVTVADGRTVTQALSYDATSGNLTLVTETAS